MEIIGGIIIVFFLIGLAWKLLGLLMIGIDERLEKRRRARSPGKPVGQGSSTKTQVSTTQQRANKEAPRPAGYRPTDIPPYIGPPRNAPRSSLRSLPGWFVDPRDRSQYRFWDGAQWTDHHTTPSDPTGRALYHLEVPFSPDPAQTPRAGWYLDPSGISKYRWWDGSRWTEECSNGSAPNPAKHGQNRRR